MVFSASLEWLRRNARMYAEQAGFFGINQLSFPQKVQGK